MQILLDTFNDEMDTCSEPDPVVEDLISTDGEVPPTQEDDDGNQSNHKISSAALLASHSVFVMFVYDMFVSTTLLSSYINI